MLPLTSMPNKRSQPAQRAGKTMGGPLCRTERDLCVVCRRRAGDRPRRPLGGGRGGRAVHARQDRPHRLHAEAADGVPLPQRRRAVLQEDGGGRGLRGARAVGRERRAERRSRRPRTSSPRASTPSSSSRSTSTSPARIAEMAADAGIPLASYDDLILSASRRPSSAATPRTAAPSAAQGRGRRACRRATTC